MTTLGKRLLKATEEAHSIARGEVEPPRIFVPKEMWT